MARRKWIKVGIVGVDSGHLMVGDPCYENHEETKFDSISDKLVLNGFPQSLQLHFNLGHAGSGVVVTSGLGDGVYDVEICEEETPNWGKRIAGVRVMFLPHPVLGK